MYSLSAEMDWTMRSIFKRQCIKCDDRDLSCPVCLETEVCSLIPAACNECARRVCIPNPDPEPVSNNESSGSGTNIGAVAGGVIGGIAFIAIITFVIWKYVIKGRRHKFDETEWDQRSGMPAEKRESEFTMRRDARMSTHTVASMASTVLTRASNIIQIAYIPGITNRSGPQSPDLLVPPVPPIPIALNNSVPSSPYSNHSQEDSHYFTLSQDLNSVRGSTYSGMSAMTGMTGMTGYSDDNRSSFHTRASITPSLARSSVATTIFRNDAVINPMPAQTVVRGKAAVVSVKSGGSGNSPLGTPTPGTPPVPQIDYASIQRPPIQIRMPQNKSSNPSLRSQSSVGTATTVKPMPVTIAKQKPSLISLNSSSSITSAPGTTPRPTTASSVASESDTEDENIRVRRSLLGNVRDSNVTAIDDTPSISQSPFADMSATITSPDFHPRSASRLGALDPVVEDDESKRSSGSIKRSKSPFSDAHAIR